MVLGPDGTVLVGHPTTRIAERPATSIGNQGPEVVGQYPGLSSVGAQPFSVQIGGLTEVDLRTAAATPIARAMAIGRQPPTGTPLAAIESHAVRVPTSPLDDADVAMALVSVPRDRRAVAAAPAVSKPRQLKRTEPPPETNSPPQAALQGENDLLRNQLLEAHERAGTLSGYVAQAMKMLQDRETWWRRAATASFQERAVILREAKDQETNLLDRMTQMGRALQHYSTNVTMSEGQRLQQEQMITSLQSYVSSLQNAGNELERRHQNAIREIEVQVQTMMSEATTKVRVAESRAAEAELRLQQISADGVNAESDYRRQCDEANKRLEKAESEFRRKEDHLKGEVAALREHAKTAYLDTAERESKFRQEIAELKSSRQPSPENLRDYEALEENLKLTTRELKISKDEVAGLRREKANLKNSVDKLQKELDIAVQEASPQRQELDEWHEQYTFQFVGGSGANSDREDRREREPKLRFGRDSGGGETSSSSWSRPRGGQPPPETWPEESEEQEAADDEETHSVRESETSSIRRQPSLSMQSSAGGNRAKEAERVDIPAWPKPAHYRAWRLGAVESVAAASATPDQAFSWMLEIDGPDASFDRLASADWTDGFGIQIDFGTLDAKLGSALTKVAPASFANTVQARKHAAMREGK